MSETVDQIEQIIESRTVMETNNGETTEQILATLIDRQLLEQLFKFLLFVVVKDDAAWISLIHLSLSCVSDMDLAPVTIRRAMAEFLLAVIGACWVPIHLRRYACRLLTNVDQVQTEKVLDLLKYVGNRRLQEDLRRHGQSDASMTNATCSRGFARGPSSIGSFQGECQGLTTSTLAPIDC
ncbi:hypothetical protein AKO1_006437 [Acrasis kona]|uniref:Uncharacterized protein n=1 Tax=Acrasis kona TaxID=1008807 RepID=A0AAW2YQI9_9EUKA